MFNNKKVRKPRWVKTARFVGRQMSRLKMGQSYYQIAMSTISAIALIFIAFELTIWILIIAFPLIFLGAFFIGYFMDIYNINSMEIFKTNEITHRFLTTSDEKNQEFQLLQLEIMLEAFKAMSENRKIEPKVLLRKFEAYYKKWKAPEE